MSSATQPSTAETDPGQALLVPRALVVLTAAWIFLAWVQLFGLQPPVQPQSASYGPAIRLLFTTLGVGIAVGWPLLRLSGPHSNAPLRQCLLDALAIFVLVQVAIWPLRLVTNWTLERTIALDVGVLAGLAQTGALLSIFLGARSVRTRTMGMGALVAIAAVAGAGELLARELPVEPAGPAGPLTALSAPSLLSNLASPRALEPDAGDRALVRAACLAAALSLALALLFATARTLIRRLQGRPRQPFDCEGAIR